MAPGYPGIGPFGAWADGLMCAAGVPAKMSTRENAHLSILRQRILIRRQHSPIKRSRENVHQPRIWTPKSLHFDTQYILHTVVKTC